MWIVYLLLGVFMFAFIVELLKKPVEQCADGDHEFWNPSLHLNDKPIRCRICGFRPGGSDSE